MNIRETKRKISLLFYIVSYVCVSHDDDDDDVMTMKNQMAARVSRYCWWFRIN